MSILDKEGAEIRPMKIAVAIPSHDTCPVMFAYDLGQMMLHSGSTLPDSVYVGVTVVTAYINEGLCQGCGACSVTCRSKSIEVQGFTDDQLFAEINAIIG